MFFEYFVFILAVLIIFFGIGFLLQAVVLQKYKNYLTSIEKLVLNFGFGIVIVNFSVIVLNQAGFSLNRPNLIIMIGLLLAILLVSWLYVDKINNSKKSIKGNVLSKYRMTKKQYLNFLLLIFLSFFISSQFLATDIVPNNTDLGHHMYYPEIMKKTDKLPNYDTSDVIVGEHISFFVLSRIANVSVLSAFPVIFLFIINCLTFLIVYSFVLRITNNVNTSLIAFGLTGVLYVVSAPMMKFASGGVVGNIFGNLFIMLVLYMIYISYKEKSSSMLALAMIFFANLFFTHHLSTFLCAFIILSYILLQIVIGFFVTKKRFYSFFRWSKIFFKPFPLIIIALFVFFIILVYTPHYISANAVETVVKTPDKDTHQGVSINSFVSSIGEYRTVLGVLGLFVFSYIYFLELKKQVKGDKKRTLILLNYSILVAWIIILCLLSFYPSLLKVDLPSRRVVNYLVIPFSILAAIFLMEFFKFFRKKTSERQFKMLVITIFLAISLNGFSDSMRYFREENQFNDTVALFDASEFLNDHTTEEDTILKDHANLAADSWIKVFLLRGYNYVLSRTFDYKYEPPNDRETCTYKMAIAPDSKKGISCYKKTGTDFVIMKKGIDNYFFDLSDNFLKIYSNDYVVIYKRKNIIKT